jgi:hypothetical protein
MTNILTYQLEGTLVMDPPLTAVYICADHSYLLFLVLDHLGLHLEHVLNQQQFAHLNPYSTLLLCFHIAFLDTIYCHPSYTFISALQVSSSQPPNCLAFETLVRMG